MMKHGAKDAVVAKDASTSECASDNLTCQGEEGAFGKTVAITPPPLAPAPPATPSSEVAIAATPVVSVSPSRRNQHHHQQHCWSTTLRRMSLLNALLFLGLALSQAQLHATASSVSTNSNNDNNSPPTSKDTKTAAASRKTPTSLLANDKANTISPSSDNSEDRDSVLEEGSDRSNKNGLHSQDESALEIDSQNQVSLGGNNDEEDDREEEDEEEEASRRPPNNVFIVATVDGTLAAIDSLSGKVLWKKAGKVSQTYGSTTNPSSTDNHHHHDGHDGIHDDDHHQ